METKILKEEIFQDCYDAWEKNKQTKKNIWKNLADKWGYSSTEALRSQFRRHKKKLGIVKKSDFMIVKQNAPKILIFDLETSYLEAAIWSLDTKYVNKSQILRDWYLLAYSCKWLYDEKVYSGILTPEEAIAGNDKRLCQEMYNFLDEANIIISYNGNAFDILKINTRFLINGIQPPSYYKSIDVYQTISRNFSFASKSLDFVTYKLELSRKKESGGIELWKKSMAGDANALTELSIYNIQDSKILEELYLQIRPWIRNHPSIGMWHDSTEPMCGYCGSTNLEYISNLYSTPSGLYFSFRCLDCHGIGRTQEKYLSKEKRKSLTRNIPQ
jgi:DNA polymerase elongation subunit (family B)